LKTASRKLDAVAEQIADVSEDERMVQRLLRRLARGFAFYIVAADLFTRMAKAGWNHRTFRRTV
jgi:hypothetical protein